MGLTIETIRNGCELSIIMPCLNEAETVAICVRKAKSFLENSGITGEVLVADNGSTDGSQELAISEGAVVIPVSSKGYGAALIGGIAAANGRYVIMGDSDDSYDFSDLEPMLIKLRSGSDLVMGNRFKGGIESGAMPFLHRHLGNPVLSFIGRLFYRSSIGDFHCGLRGFNTESIRNLDLGSSGMEFASEMIVKSALNHLQIAEVPVKLYPDGRSRPPHLRTWRDGWRHLRFLLLHSPRWLFLIPGIFMIVSGGLAMVAIAYHTFVIGGLGLDIHTLSYAGAAIVLGVQMVIFSAMTKLLGIRNGWLPNSGLGRKWLSSLTLEGCLIAGCALFLLGLLLSGYAVHLWALADFGPLEPVSTMRWVIPSVTFMAVGGEICLSAFFLEAIRQPNKSL